MKNIYNYLLRALGNKNSLVLATIVHTEKSAPQIPGASALFFSGGLLCGTLGGGILEADAQNRALDSLGKRKPLLYKLDLNSDISSEDGAICGGEATILIDPCPETHIDVFKSMNESISQGRPGVLATSINKSRQKKVSLVRHWTEGEENSCVKSDILYEPYKKDIARSLAENRSCFIPIEEGRISASTEASYLFLEPVYPLPRLIIAGAGHIGRAFSHLAGLLDFEVTVIDDRPEFANKALLPDADHIIVGDMKNALQDISIGSNTYVAIVTRGHRGDADALRQCIGSEAAYIGMIGSSRKIGLMKEEFVRNRWATPDQWEQIYAPIGIDIDSKTVQEIAVSIAAQVVLVRHEKPNNEKRS